MTLSYSTEKRVKVSQMIAALVSVALMPSCYLTDFARSDSGKARGGHFAS
jgi:hypothetical protein